MLFASVGTPHRNIQTNTQKHIGHIPPSVMTCGKNLHPSHQREELITNIKQARATRADAKRQQKAACVIQRIFRYVTA